MKRSHDSNPGMYCKRCVYDLHGVTGAQCPECGKTFSASDPATYDASPRSRRIRWWPRWAVIVGVVSIVLYLFVPRGWDSITLALDDGTKTTGATAFGFKRPSWWGGYHLAWVCDKYAASPGVTSQQPSGVQGISTVHRSGTNLQIIEFETLGTLEMSSKMSTTPPAGAGKIPRVRVDLQTPSGASPVVVEFDNPRKAVRELMLMQEMHGLNMNYAWTFMKPIAR